MNKKSLRNLLLRVITISVLFFGVAVSYLWIDYVSLEEQRSIPNRSVSKDMTNHIRIGIIGESWAAGRKIDDYLEAKLDHLGINSEIVSIGHPGAKSKLIYQDLFAPEEQLYTSREILFGKPLDYCIVLSGVNDTAAYVGANFYAHHLNLISEALISRGITPIVVQVPEYGIEEISRPRLPGMLRSFLMRWIHDGGEIDVITKYRNVSRERIEKLIKAGKLLYFDFNAVSTDYKQDINLYKSDLVHLNDIGNQKLGEELALFIEYHVDPSN